MADAETCPNCGHDVGIPGMFHGGGTSEMPMHTHQECAKCKRPLIWFNTDTDIGSHWRIDEEEERIRRRRQGAD